MSNRTERRAAERVASKLAESQPQRQQVEVLTPVSGSDMSSSTSVSPAQLMANRANAKLSTGPVTAEGKAKSSANALRHGLTGRTVILASEDTAEYDRQVAEMVERFQPADFEERRLVQSVVDCTWRLNRVQQIESAILLKGALEFAGKFEDSAPAERELLIQAETYLKYERSLRNLHIQEGRLRRTQEQDRLELKRIQIARKRAATITAETIPAALPVNGFEFATGHDHAQDSPVRACPPCRPGFPMSNAASHHLATAE